MSIVEILFYVFAVFLVTAAVGVITARNPVHCALFLVLVPYGTQKLGEALLLSPDMQLKLKGNLPLAIFGLALIVVTIIAPGGIQALVRRIGAWLVGLVRRPAG